MRASSMSEERASKVMQRWVGRRGRRAISVRSSLLSWTIEQPGDTQDQLEAVHALLDMAKFLALGLPDGHDKIAEAFYAAADEITIPRSD